MSTNPTVSNARTIARNSLWWGLELFFSLFAAFVTSIIVARVIGPERLGYFQYVVWLTNITTAVGSVGLPMTTRKYVAEHLNRGEAPVARAVYEVGLWLQILISAAVTLAGLGLVFLAGDPAQRLISAILVINMAPRMIGLIPSQANNAAELMKRSTAPAVIGGSLNVGLTLLSLWAGWDLPGIALSFLAGSTVETALKLWDVRRRMSAVPAGKISPELRRRMLSYSGQGLVLMLLNVTVWDKSDLIVLKHLNPDIAQVTFFSLAFNLTERVLMIPSAFGTSLGVTMMAQYGRGEERLRQLVVPGAKYSFLLALPLLLGLACLSGPVVRLYGDKYGPLAPVLAIAAVMAIPKVLIAAPTALLQATEKQGALIWVGCGCGALDILLDVLLTPAHGAQGAAWANGIAQTAAAILTWAYARRVFRLDLQPGQFGRIALSGLAMAAAVVGVGHRARGYAGVAAAILAGALTWFAVLRLTGALEESDRERLRRIGGALPGAMRPLFDRIVTLLA